MRDCSYSNSNNSIDFIYSERNNKYIYTFIKVDNIIYNFIYIGINLNFNNIYIIAFLI